MRNSVSNFATSAIRGKIQSTNLSGDSDRSCFPMNGRHEIQHSTNKSARIFGGDLRILLSACELHSYGGKMFAELG